MYKKTIIILISMIFSASAVNAESLFRAGVSQNDYYYQPRSLYGSVRAKTIGDLVTISVNNIVSTSDEINLAATKTSAVTDKFSTIINDILNKKDLVPNVNGFGGTNTTSNKSALTRKTKIVDTVTAQVVQVLPNGNLLVQGKKTSVNAGEKMDLVVSGIVDPRFLDKTGKINSNQVANFQIAVTGKGTVSGVDSEGTLNKYIKYLY